MERKKITVKDFIKKKSKGEKLVLVTAYDYITAKLVDEAGVDGILVGDSLGMVILGYSSTLPVTMDEVIHHLKAVVNAKPKALVIADMPFLSYEISRSEAVANAGKLIKVGAEAVKVEGGVEVFDKVEAMVRVGIPVMGHIGLTPQRALTIGGYKLRGKDVETAKKIVEDAKALEEAGVFAIVLEFTTAEIAEYITKILKIPVIGIGSGPHCDGQIVVINDIIGLTPNPPPFIKRYANVAQIIVEAVKEYIKEVKEGTFPGEEHTKHMKPEEYEVFKKEFKL